MLLVGLAAGPRALLVLRGGADARLREAGPATFPPARPRVSVWLRHEPARRFQPSRPASLPKTTPPTPPTPRAEFRRELFPERKWEGSDAGDPAGAHADPADGPEPGGCV